MYKLLLLFGFLCSCSCMSLLAESSKRMTVTSPDGQKKMFFEHAAKSDLEGSASGYIYRSDGKGPATIVQLGEDHYSEPHDFTQFVNHGYESFVEPAKFAPLKFAPIKYEPIKYEPVKYEQIKYEPVRYEPVKYEAVEAGPYFGGEYFVGGKGHLGGFGGGEKYFGGEEGGKFAKESGHKNNEEYYHEGGEKGGKGYKDSDEFKKELLKKLYDNQEEAFKKQAGGDKKHHFEEGEKYEDVKEEKKGEDGESFSAKKSHKKGHKTTGFHNVYHKDEFKKQHSFFDEADDDGHQEKYGDNYEEHGAEGGSYKKAGHSNSGHESDEFLKKGDFHKGEHESAAKGFRESEGGNSHFANNAEYGTKGGKHFQKAYGFAGGYGGHGDEY